MCWPAYSGVRACGVRCVRATFLLLMGFLLGYLAEIEKRFRRRARLVADVLAGVQRRPGLRGAVRAVLGGFLDFYRAGQGVLVAAAEGRQALAWEAHRMPGGQVAVSLRKPAPWLEWLGAIPPARAGAERRGQAATFSNASKRCRRGTDGVSLAGGYPFPGAAG